MPTKWKPTLTKIKSEDLVGKKRNDIPRVYIAERCAKACWPRMVRYWELPDNDIDELNSAWSDLVEAFSDNFWEQDAYKMVKRMEDDCQLEGSSEAIDIIECGFGESYPTERDLLHMWVVANNITPAFKVGDMVKSKHCSGKIVTIYEKEAKYAIHNASHEAQSKPGHVVHGIPFEECTLDKAPNTQG